MRKVCAFCGAFQYLAAFHYIAAFHAVIAKLYGIKMGLIGKKLSIHLTFYKIKSVFCLVNKTMYSKN